MTPTNQRARGLRQFALGIALYMITLILQVLLFKPATLPPVVGVVLAVLPVAFAIWALWGWIKAVSTFDELQRKIFGEAGLFSLGVTVALTFTYGFLEAYLGAPRLSMLLILPVVAGTSALGLLMVRRRYQ